MELYIEAKSKGEAAIIEVRGEVDIYTSPTMREYIFTTIKQQQPQSFIVELSGVTYTDSSGIATLVEGLQLANEHNVRFKLVGLSQSVLEVFQLARLERVFDIYSTEDAALQAG